jgi:hypothetical protein
MNTTGDAEEHSERLTPGMPLSAPVAADVRPGREANPYFTRPSAPPAPASRAPVPVQFARHAAPSEPPDASASPDPFTAGAAPLPPPPAPAARHAEAVGRDRNAPLRESPSHADYRISGSPAGEPPEDPTRVILRKHLDALRIRAANASSWVEASAHYTQLVNRDGYVPVNTRLSREDIEFLGRAREEVLGFAELGLRLLDLHAPLDAGGISTDPSSPILRCRSCMWRWPCPTFRTLDDALSQLPHRSPPTRGTATGLGKD